MQRLEPLFIQRQHFYTAAPTMGSRRGRSSLDEGWMMSNRLFIALSVATGLLVICGSALMISDLF
jgi:hypothetical protein